MDTGEEETGGGFPPPSRFRIFGRQLGYTQTETGKRKPWMLMEEYMEWAEYTGQNKQAEEAAIQDLMED